MEFLMKRLLKKKPPLLKLKPSLNPRLRLLLKPPPLKTMLTETVSLMPKIPTMMVMEFLMKMITMASPTRKKVLLLKRLLKILKPLKVTTAETRRQSSPRKRWRRILLCPSKPLLQEVKQPPPRQPSKRRKKKTKKKKKKKRKYL